jgi:hypothetical protein
LLSSLDLPSQPARRAFRPITASWPSSHLPLSFCHRHAGSTGQPPPLFSFPLPPSTRDGIVGQRGATQAAPPMAAAPTVLAPADACHAARNRSPPSLWSRNPSWPPYKPHRAGNSIHRRRLGTWPCPLLEKKRRGGKEKGGAQEAGSEPGGARFPRRRPGATAERHLRRRPGATAGRHLRRRAGDLADRSRSCSQAPRLRRRAGNAAAPASPALRPSLRADAAALKLLPGAPATSNRSSDSAR